MAKEKGKTKTEEDFYKTSHYGLAMLIWIPFKIQCDNKTKAGCGVNECRQPVSSYGNFQKKSEQKVILCVLSIVWLIGCCYGIWRQFGSEIGGC